MARLLTIVNAPPILLALGVSILLAVAISNTNANADTVGAVSTIAAYDAYEIHEKNTAWQPGADSARLGNHGWPGGATYSIMDGGHSSVTDLSKLHGEHQSLPITALDVPGYTMTNYYADLHWAFRTWAAVSGFTNLGYTPDGNVDEGATSQDGGVLGDIRIAAWEIESPSVLAITFQPDTETLSADKGTLGGDIHFDVNRRWVNDPYHQSNHREYDFRTILLHEVGHALGLGHSLNQSGSVMHSSYAGAKRHLFADDIAGIQALYGEPPEEGTSPLIGRQDVALALSVFTHTTGDGQNSGDWNSDGIVALDDLAVIQLRLGEQRSAIGSSSQAVPEPGGLTLMFLAMLPFLFRHRRWRRNG